MQKTRLYKIRKNWIDKNIKYQFLYWQRFNYEVLSNAMYYKKRGHGNHKNVNEVWIMADTETSKKPNTEANHIVAFTVSIRMFDKNIVTLWGRKPSDLIECLDKIHNSMKGAQTVFYIHNLGYDYVFLRKFMFKKWGYPEKELSLKSHAPLYIEFENGIIFKDSFILAQRKLEKWANDLEVEHKKAVGKWDYNKIRSQYENFTNDELQYIECDTLAGVECLDTLSKQLKKHACDMPYTATGIPREAVRKIGAQNRARDLFERICPNYQQYEKLTKVFHGGYTHANRFISGQIINEGGKCYDFSSSYPFCMCAFKEFPMSRFESIDDKPIDYILKYSDKYAFMFKLIMLRPKLKPNLEMPVLQASKSVELVNPIIDNGRILQAEYISIYLNEIDLQVIAQQYDYDFAICKEVEFASKGYLPRWFTDYVYSLYIAKCTLKHSDPLLYRLKKGELNSCYGMCVMRNVRLEIIEDYVTGEYYANNEKDPESIYKKYIGNKNTILPYMWGVWVTSLALRDLHELATCIYKDSEDPEKNGIWLYSDTDSIYATKWDENKVAAYNEKCKALLRANGYEGVEFEGQEYWLGVAESGPEDVFTEFITQGAKRYCKRTEDGLHITIAGVPKKGVECLNDNIANFQPGLIFPGTKTGKLTHKYIYVPDIYIDEWGNETGDSIDLTPCDYLLSHEGYTDFEYLDDELRLVSKEYMQTY